MLVPQTTQGALYYARRLAFYTPCELTRINDRQAIRTLQLVPPSPKENYLDSNPPRTYTDMDFNELIRDVIITDDVMPKEGYNPYVNQAKTMVD